MSQSSAANSAAPKLLQFRYAMFPEKARWALDLCGINYHSQAILPGPHVPILAIKAQQKTVPVLQTTDGTFKNSSQIMEWASNQKPELKLYGDSAQERQAIQAHISYFDDIGAHARRAYFNALLQDTRYAADLFSSGYSPKAQAVYRASFPMIKGVMKVDMNIWPKAVAQSLSKTEEALDRVAGLSQKTGYLVGSQFTAADLTAATVLGVCVLPDEYPVSVPQPRPAALQAWQKRWENHPGAAWVKHIYQQHRPKPLAIGGL